MAWSSAGVQWKVDIPAVSCDAPYFREGILTVRFHVVS